MSILFRTSVNINDPVELSIDLTVNETYTPGDYDIRVTVAESSVSSFATFSVIDDPMMLQIERLKLALECRLTASTDIKQGRLTDAVWPLRRAADIYSQLSCHVCAASAWNDLAHLCLKLNRKGFSLDALRRALWEYLQQEWLRRQCAAAAMSAPISIKTITNLLDICDLALQIRPNEFQDMCHLLLLSLSTLNERSSEYEAFLHTAMGEAGYAAASYQALATINAKLAIDVLPRFTESAVRFSRQSEYCRTIAAVVQETGPGLFYLQAPILLRTMTSAECEALFLNTLYKLFPLIPADDMCYIVLDNDRNQVIDSIPSTTEMLYAFREFISAADYHDAEAEVDAASSMTGIHRHD